MVRQKGSQMTVVDVRKKTEALGKEGIKKGGRLREELELFLSE